MTVVRAVRAVETRGIRQSVLRPHQPPEACEYPGDDEPDTLHVGAFEDERLVGVASLYRMSPDGEPLRAGDWRLRGMATLPALRGQGIGAALLDACVAHARARGGVRVWCNARTTAGAFYARLGFVRVGDAYDIPGIGPHWFMERAL